MGFSHQHTKAVEPIYKRYKVQIDTIFQIMDSNYRKSAKIISWLYGGSDETWRKFLASNKPSKIPPEIEELFKKLKGS